jgi:hypothetical protein
MTISIRLQARLFIVGDGVANTLTLPLGDYPLQDVPRKAIVTGVSTADPSLFTAILDAAGKNVIVSTIDSSPFPGAYDSFINVNIAV